MPKPSPDGRWIAFAAADDAGIHALVMRPDGSDVHRLIPEALGQYTFSGLEGWSPDGDRLMYTAATKQQPWTAYLATVDRDTGTVRDPVALKLPGMTCERFAWSPDGRFVVYEAVSDGGWVLWIVDTDGMNARRLTADPGNERGARWSPDGRFLYYVKNYRSLWRLPMDADGKPTGPAKLWAEFPRTRLESDALAIDSDRFVLSVQEEAGDLWLVEFPDPARPVNSTWPWR
jgi:Tol biopolymer transport system component